MQNVIIHTDTRVVRRLTTDENPAIREDESVVTLDEPIDLAGGFWKLDDKDEKVPASNKDIDDADVDEEKVALKKKAKKEAVRLAIKDLANLNLDAQGQLGAKLKAYFQALDDLG